ncbi:MAG TPA: MqnA/MqnD/SBP family protein, partial [Candidatus Obscuribacterales bacterium]
MQVAQDKALDGVAVDPAPRLGQINFVNSLPVVLPLMRGYASVKGEITLESPAALNELYFVGRLDAGAMSSFFYLQHSDDLTLLPNVSISTSGAVGSVLFFFRSQPSGGKPYRLAVPSSSATSVALLQLYLLETFGVSPLIHSLSEPDAMDERFDGVLVIGDRALLEDDRWSSNFQRVDLGSWWLSTFSLPMVLGVWAARTHWAQQFAGSFMAVCDAICRARDI